jgi:hypothetical protein
MNRRQSAIGYCTTRNIKNPPRTNLWKVVRCFTTKLPPRKNGAGRTRTYVFRSILDERDGPLPLATHQ